jgi:polygalacturonase
MQQRRLVIPVILAGLLSWMIFLQAFAQAGDALESYSSGFDGISEDTLYVASGTTYSYTVDTPEGAGLVSTVLSADRLAEQIRLNGGSVRHVAITERDGQTPRTGELKTGDLLWITAEKEKSPKKYVVQLRSMAVGGILEFGRNEATAGLLDDMVVRFTAGQRTPDATVRIFIPEGIHVSKEDVWVNVIGRGSVQLNDLDHQSVGRVGTDYSCSKVGTAQLEKSAKGEICLVFRHLDLRPSNGADLEIILKNVTFPKAGEYRFRAGYETSQPEKLKSPGIGAEQAVLFVKNEITDFVRIADREMNWIENHQTYTATSLRWTPISTNNILLECSTDSGNTWRTCPAEIIAKQGIAKVSGLEVNREYAFRLSVQDGKHKGFSNIAYFYSGKLDAKKMGIVADGKHDNTIPINQAIAYLHRLGGGTLRFSDGVYCVQTVYLKSNVWLYVDKGATIKALKGSYEPERTWFSDRKYRSGLSPTDSGPYDDPENYLTKQDVGHTFFRNSMFFGERLDNVKIVGNGRITGDGNLNTGDKVMNKEPGNRADKMFSLKLCTNLEIGGIPRREDLWYDEKTDEPYYFSSDGNSYPDTENMLDIDRAGHFVLLATGTDHIQVHDTYFGKNSTSDARDIYDFMSCNNVEVRNIYCKQSSDDIVKLGSDCALGFTRPAMNYKVRNIVGDTNCNLFQIGSETADDITDVCVDNIYVLGANKAGFSISTNDGGHVRNIHLNCGHTGPIHIRSKMYRTTTPFFISISNRGRVLGANVSRYKFSEKGTLHDELLCTNVNIGEVENISLNGVDCYEVYSGSSFRSERWKAFDGSQRKAAPIVAGYKLPGSVEVDGGLNFRLPNGKHTGYVTNIAFTDVHVLVKGGNPLADSKSSPPELGVGQYNVSNLGILPSYGIWARHVKKLSVENCSFSFEKMDQRYAIFLDDVKGGTINSVLMMRTDSIDGPLKSVNSERIDMKNLTFSTIGE